MRSRHLVVLGVVVLLLGACEDGGGEGSDLRVRKTKPDPQCGRAEYPEFDQCLFEIDLYCEYGAVSRAQLEGCKGHVTWGQIKRLDTSAARFARLELGKCLADAGPFCHASSQPGPEDYEQFP